jgi:heme a synthase
MPVPPYIDSIDVAHRAALRAWLWSIAAMTLAVLIVGGITRLTQSGLSIVDWKPLMGVIPPLNEAQWLERFEQYRQYPEYQQLRRGMSLDEFRFIYFWEYMHRLVARMIGVVFLIPFVIFAVRRRFSRGFAARALVLFALGGAQGVLGWLMVRSGLADQPHVSHYRLAAHLSLAFIIFGYAVWLARELRPDTRTAAEPAARRTMLRGLGWVGALLAVQVVYGAFVAGLRAGFFYNTFPLMGGSLLPPHMWAHSPWLSNLVANPYTVQWLHRVIGTLLLIAAVVHFVRVLRAGVDPLSQRLNLALGSLIALQYGLGVLTLIMVVPVTLGVAHQAMAMVILGVWLVWLHHARRLATGADEAVARRASELALARAAVRPG